MLGKLIKYEFHAVSRLLLPLHLALILITFVGRFYVQFAVSNMNQKFELLNVSLVMFYIFAIFAVLLLTHVYLYILRPHRNLFSDEGYLMHTLPVTASMHIWSKLIVAMCWILLDLFLIGLSLFCLLVNPEFLASWPDFVDEIREMVLTVTGMDFILGSLTYILNFFITSAQGILLVYMCLAIGHSFNQYKLLISIGIYIGVYMGTSLINTLASILVGNPLGMGAASLITNTSAEQLASTSRFLTWFDTLFALAMAVIAFLVTRYFLTKRLNLE